MRFFTIASLLVATAHIALSAPIDSVARRAQDGGAVMIPIPPSNGVVQHADNEEQDLLVRELFARELFSDGPYVLFTRTLFGIGQNKPPAADLSTSGTEVRQPRKLRKRRPNPSNTPADRTSKKSNILSIFRSKKPKPPPVPERNVERSVLRKEDGLAGVALSGPPPPGLRVQEELSSHVNRAASSSPVTTEDMAPQQPAAKDVDKEHVDKEQPTAKDVDKNQPTAKDVDKEQPVPTQKDLARLPLNTKTSDSSLRSRIRKWRNEVPPFSPELPLPPAPPPSPVSPVRPVSPVHPVPPTPPPSPVSPVLPAPPPRPRSLPSLPCPRAPHRTGNAKRHDSFATPTDTETRTR
ncbi:hypothetical protein K439DRAFT_855861 [Ramaria rubella]|nr:hypothetical protein K439DRAFT_855861 [Ramaria rubella]